MEPRIVVTGDGSTTIYSQEYDDHYHSLNGAIAEAQHIFIENGFNQLLQKNKKNFNILDIGFGTGLNALLTYNASLNTPLKINYIAIEPNPLPVEILEKLSFPPLFDNIELKEIFFSMHNFPKGYPHYLNDNFIINIIEAKLQDVYLAEGSFDLVYFDPFKPKTHTDMWAAEIFKKVYESLKFDGILVTYSSSGLVRKNMEEAGFTVEKLPGPKGKKEITRAIKKIELPICEKHCKTCHSTH